MDGKHLAFKSESIPCITSFFGFDNIPECEKAFRETYRTLDQNGRLAFTTLWLKKDSKSLDLAEKHGYGKIGTEERMRVVLEETGFKCDFTKIFFSGYWPHNPMDLIPVENDWFAHALIMAHKK